MEKYVIYRMSNNEVIRVVSGIPSLSELKNDEDFVSVKTWNEGCEFLGLSKIEDKE